MRRVKNKNTNIEILIRRLLFKKGYRFRIKSSLFGKPDIIFPRQKIAVFCDGDFWHGKNYLKDKRTYKKFWRDKIAINIKRDKQVNRRLKKDGWIVLRFWKSNILKNPDKCVEKISQRISF